MGRLAGISARRAIGAFCRAGYQISRRRGSHVILQRQDTPNLVIPIIVIPIIALSPLSSCDLNFEGRA